MYPDLEVKVENSSIRNALTFQKTLPPSQAMTSTILELKQSYALSSFKPHLNYYQCFMSLVVQNKYNIPLRIVFLRNYPKQKPLIYISKFVVHPSINSLTSEILYEQFHPWYQHASLTQLLDKIRSQFADIAPQDKSQIDVTLKEYEDFLRNIQNLRKMNPNQQPPLPPNRSMESILQFFQTQEITYGQCLEKIKLYLITAKQFAENCSRVKCISEKFSRGKILKELEKQQQAQMLAQKSEKFQDQLKNYYQNRKKYHRIKILKQRYLEH